MKTDKELIAEFLGWNVLRAGAQYNKDSWYEPVKDKRKLGEWKGYTDNLQFAESWDWLKPVVDKIGKLWEEYPVIDWQNDKAVDEFMLVCGLPLDTSIDKAYLAVVNFIKWYNQNKSE